MYTTTIPYYGCNDFYFTSPKLIQKGKKALMGKLNMWLQKLVELMDILTNVKGVHRDCFFKQRIFPSFIPSHRS